MNVRTRIHMSVSSFFTTYGGTPLHSSVICCWVPPNNVCCCQDRLDPTSGEDLSTGICSIIV